MLNFIWLLLIAVGVAMAVWNGQVEPLTSAVMEAADEAVKLALGLIGMVAFWSGLMRIAEEAGLIRGLAKALRPLTRLLFPSVPPESKAMDAVLMSISANILGIGNASTPLGLNAMKELQELNVDKERASDAMCTFVALTMSGITLLPSTVIAIRAQAGSAVPGAVIGTTLFSSGCATLAAILLDRFLRRRIRATGGGKGGKGR